MLQLKYKVSNSDITKVIPEALKSFDKDTISDSIISKESVILTLKSAFIDVLALEYAKKYDNEGVEHNMIFVVPQISNIEYGKQSINFTFTFVAAKVITPNEPIRTPTPFERDSMLVESMEQEDGIDVTPYDLEDDPLEIFGKEPNEKCL
jgi:hypothetical protein